MRLAVINHWKDKKSAVFWNKDGFLRMLDVLRKRDKWEVKFFKKHDRTFEWEHDYVDLAFSPNPTAALLAWKPDAILVFADFSSDSLRDLKDCGIPIGLCYTGGRFTDYERVPNIVFVESKSYLDWMKPRGINVVRAFGTNTELFKPRKQPKLFDAIQTSTFAGWKRHELYSEALGKTHKALACGWFQETEPQCWQVCQEKGIMLLHHQMAESIAWLYNASHTTVLTASDVGGSQRSVLESMASGVPPVVMADSTMTTEYVREAGYGLIVEPDPNAIRAAVDQLKAHPQDPQKGIDYIKSKYTEYHYADAVKAGVLSICKL